MRTKAHSVVAENHARHNEEEGAKHTIPEDGEDGEGEKCPEYDE